jgi:hypothetical protein
MLGGMVAEFVFCFFFVFFPFAGDAGGYGSRIWGRGRSQTEEKTREEAF